MMRACWSCLAGTRSVSYGFNPAADYRAEVRDQAGLLWSVLVKRWGIFAELVGREKYFQRGGGRGVFACQRL